jgi:hypothetical protein
MTNKLTSFQQELMDAAKHWLLMNDKVAGQYEVAAEAKFKALVMRAREIPTPLTGAELTNAQNAAMAKRIFG